MDSFQDRRITKEMKRARKRRRAIKIRIVEISAAILMLICVFFFYTGTSGENTDSTSEVNEQSQAVSKADSNEEEATEAPTPEVSSEEETIAEAVTASEAKINSKYVSLVSEDGTVIYSKDGDTQMNPASLTKLMTALVVVHNVDDLTQTAQISQDTANYTFSNGASVAGFEVGEEATLEELLYGVLLPSGAECSLTLAEYVAGSQEDFVTMMNEEAEQLGMVNTHFTNCVGLTETGHYSSTNDIAILLKECMQEDVLKEIMSKKQYTVEKTNIHEDGFTFYSTVYTKFNNIKLTGIDILGGKTGYTEEAGYCLATAAEIENSQFILVTAGGEVGDETISAKDASIIYKKIYKALTTE